MAWFQNWVDNFCWGETFQEVLTYVWIYIDSQMTSNNQHLIGLHSCKRFVAILETFAQYQVVGVNLWVDIP
jgi:hypothetical protein